MANSDPSPQTWDPSLYAQKHAFVWQAGQGILDLLAPHADERILDVGCGTGELTAKIAASGATVVGIDATPEMIQRAKAVYTNIDFRHCDVLDLEPLAEGLFDAVFSNAALHWVMEAERAIQRMRSVLKPSGRLVLEMGGHGNIATIHQAVRDAVSSIGKNPTDVPDFLYFPCISVYTALLEKNGFEVSLAQLFDRPTPLDEGSAGLRNWVRMFKGAYLKNLSPGELETVFQRVEEQCRPTLWKSDHWIADYRRLRVVAKAV